MSDTDTITIQGHDFTVPVRYAEGHVLKANEAKALNQTYHENLRNNFAGAVKKAKEGLADGAELSEDAIAALQAELDKYATEYEFNVRTSSGPRTPADPVEAEALRMARKAVRDAIKAAGGKPADYDDDSIEAAAKQVLEDNPAIREAAATIVANRQAVAGTKITLPSAKAA